MQSTDTSLLGRVLANLEELNVRIRRDRAAITSYKRHVPLDLHETGIGLLPGDDEDDDDNETLFICENEPVDQDGDDDPAQELTLDDEDIYVGVGGHEVEGDEDEDVDWMNSLATNIRSLHMPFPPGFPEPCLGLLHEPKDYQYRALGFIERATTSDQKALCLADPPGLGKTLPAMMATIKAAATARQFSIVITLSSCVNQWAEEYQKFFTDQTVRVLIVRDSSIPPNVMLDYDVIITSYVFVTHCYRRRIGYLEAIQQYRQDHSNKRPVRPDLSVLSEIFEENKHPFLVLDEVNAVKNEMTRAFKAINMLRSRSDVCLMLTGSPIDNAWPDVYAFLQFLDQHPIRTKRQLLRLCGTEDVNHAGKYKPPSGSRFLRYIQLLNSFIIRRPETTIQLPQLHETEVVFGLNPTEERLSNACFEKYQIAIRISAKERDKNAEPPFKSLTHSLQHACHSRMVELMAAIKTDKHNAKNPLSAEEDDTLDDAKAIQTWVTWRTRLGRDGDWRSSRIDSIIDIINRQRDLDPEACVVIFDESVYFLDVVQIALTSMYDPVQCLRYDGRVAPERRDDVLTSFRGSPGKVLLVSRRSGGIGKNIAWANVVILCSPWWKTEWEVQAMKRVWMQGQTREVFVFRLVAGNCKVETYKRKIRDSKHRFNTKAVDMITRRDGEMPRVWENFA